ncbi:adenosine receptor A2a-like [Xenia sp. Carnegie-2017]|uniref:adenosine receptor A2a-like n=1 Tax=Xenia sp. Carnegie-2017 TaxID=2897299 RepID=UPI001F032F58|nr:adenosine receptor A2a-like [Xenia sp. Carnegie-2017]
MFSFNSSELHVAWCGLASYLTSTPTTNIITANTVVIIVDMFLAVFTVVVNGLFISTYFNNRNLQNTSNMLLVTLAVSDILVGGLALPLAITRATMEILETFNCTLFNLSRLVYIFCSGLSFLTIILITYDRYIAIYYPLRYHLLMSKRNTKICLIACGILVIGLLLCRVYLSLERFFLIICSLTFFTTLSALLVYTKILLAARRHNLQIQNMTGSFKSSRQIIAFREIKTTKVMVYILGAMILCYYPGTCFWIYSAFHGYTLESLYTIVPYMESAVFLNSAINPLTYLLRNRNIRCAFSKHLHELFYKHTL